MKYIILLLLLLFNLKTFDDNFFSILKGRFLTWSSFDLFNLFFFYIHHFICFQLSVYLFLMISCFQLGSAFSLVCFKFITVSNKLHLICFPVSKRDPVFSQQYDARPFLLVDTLAHTLLMNSLVLFTHVYHIVHNVLETMYTLFDRISKTETVHLGNLFSQLIDDHYKSNQ